MSNTKLYDFYIGLIPNLVTDLLFYIPKVEIPSDIFEEFKELEEQKVFNRLFVFDKYKGPISFNRNINRKGVLSLPVSLEKNIFSLVEKKREVTAGEFKFLLKKYSIFAEALLYYSRWMHNNLSETFGNDEGQKRLFYHQFANFKKHFETLVTTFYDSGRSFPKENFTTDHIVNDFIPDLARSYSKRKIADLVTKTKIPIIVPKFSIPKGTIESKDKTPKSKNNTKIPLLTEPDAEKILLRTYFGIE